MTKALLLNDIHLNFLRKHELIGFMDKIAAEEPDILLIGGDIAEAPKLEEYLHILAALGKPVYFVLGNHDYYQGSIASVRKRMIELTREKGNNLHWLPEEGIVELDADTALIGVDGWYDAGYGTPMTSHVIMDEWAYIDELKDVRHSWHRPALIERLERMGTNETMTARKLLTEALRSYNRVIFITHVPAWKEASYYGGKMSDNNWLPWFSCARMGTMLEELAKKNPDKKIEVYQGHSHGLREYDVLPNLKSRTGAATYGSPEIQKSLTFG